MIFDRGRRLKSKNCSGGDTEERELLSVLSSLLIFFFHHLLPTQEGKRRPNAQAALGDKSAVDPRYLAREERDKEPITG